MAGLKDTLKHIMPERMRMTQLVLRRAKAWQVAGLIFVHVPKNGGTSINNALYRRFMGHYRVSDIERVRPDLFSSLPSLAVSRNPWTRTYSAWNFARMGAEMNDGAQIKNPERYRVPEFASFERFVLEWLPGRDLEREDYVFRSQSQFLLTHKGDIGVSHLGRIEDAGTYLPFLEETLGQKVEIGHLNRSTNPSRHSEIYTPAMRDVVARCYETDLLRFSYDF
jgi:hypothetical protein